MENERLRGILVKLNVIQSQLVKVREYVNAIHILQLLGTHNRHFTKFSEMCLNIKLYLFW